MHKIAPKRIIISHGGCCIVYKLNYLIRGLTTSTTAPVERPDTLMMSHTSYEDRNYHQGAKVPPLLVLHGLFSEKKQWKSMCELILRKLTPKRKIIAVDLRNHGDSPHNYRHGYGELSNDIQNFVQTMTIDKTCLLGHGMGGMAAMYYALKFPLQVDKLIVVDIAPAKYHNSRMLDYLVAAMTDVKVPNNVEMEVGMSLANEQLAKKIRSPNLRALILSNLMKSPDGRVNLLAIKEHVRDITSFPDAKGVYKNKALFITGKKSKIFRVPEDFTNIRKYFPSSTIESVENAGHNVHVAQPQKFVKLCTQYLNDMVGCE